MRLALLFLAVIVAGAQMPKFDGSQPANPAKRMSFHNRLLLNRAVLGGVKSIEVLVLASAMNLDERRAGIRASGLRFRTTEASDVVSRLGGRVQRADEAIGYLRVEVPTHRTVELSRSPAVAAYQLASFSRGSWYRDGPPLSNAQMYRGFEVTPIVTARTDDSHPDLPMLSVAESRASGFTLNDDAGVGDWMKAHPTFDGRGVTIALVENALPNFTDPTFRTARTLDGREVAKIAGIVNTIDASDADETRVHLDTELAGTTSWARVGRRTFILPRPGRYRFGMLVLPGGGNVVHEFGVVEHQQTREVWIDSNGDASFADERPLADINERFEPGFLRLAYPTRVDVSFVMGRGRLPHTVHIYLGRGSHQSMTLSVAAGNVTNESLAHGVAPGARILLVRSRSQDYQLTGILEGFIEAARRTDVDVVSASAGINVVPDTAADFVGLFLERLVTEYRKPMINAAGNSHLQLGSSFSAGASLTVGGTLGPETLAALHGGRALDRMLVHPTGAAGPSLDGAIKPDFLAPMERLATDLPWAHSVGAVPRNAPTHRVPPGYQVSCCTSAASPYAAGFVALLISAAKQTNLPYSVEKLDHALKLSSRFLDGFQSHEQGNGALDIAAAWKALNNPVEPPHIVATARVVHPLAQYAARGTEGQGILEFDGWTAGMTGTRDIQLRRESGPERPITYRVTLSGNDGTYEIAPSVTLSLKETVTLPVKIHPTSSGAHSVLVNLVDESTNSVVFRTQATIVATERFDASTGSLRMTGHVGLMRVQSHYFHIPVGTPAVSIELDVFRGVVRPTILPAHGLFPGYYPHVHPINARFVGKGKHTVLMPNPKPGTWTIQAENTSGRSRAGAGDTVPGDDADAEYAVTVRLLDASINARSTSPDAVELDLRNAGSTIHEPVVEASSATLRSHRGSFHPTGFPNLFDIMVPAGTRTLALKLRSHQPDTNTVELFLYDCTTGECFSYDLGFPAAASHTMVVRKPNAGRWVAAVNTAPFPAASGSFVLEDIITFGSPVRRILRGAQPPGAGWTETITADAVRASSEPRSTAIFIELLDAASDRDEVEHPWVMGPNAPRLRDRPVALGTSIYRR